MAEKRERHVELLERLAERDLPVHGASTALAHTQRGHGYLCEDELRDVWAALDEWDEAGAPEPVPSDYPYMRRIPTYGRVVTALTHYGFVCRRAVFSHG